MPAGLPHASPYPCRIYSLQIPAQIAVVSRKYAKIPQTSPEGSKGPFLGDSQQKRIKVRLKWKLTQILGVFFPPFLGGFRVIGAIITGFTFPGKSGHFADFSGDRIRESEPDTGPDSLWRSYDQAGCPAGDWGNGYAAVITYTDIPPGGIAWPTVPSGLKTYSSPCLQTFSDFFLESLEEWLKKISKVFPEFFGNLWQHNKIIWNVRKTTPDFFWYTVDCVIFSWWSW